ncbi:MAG: peptidase S9 [Planctomycetaceae bacterium]|nr:peptidase S9 [Planctomycetaceae bacterium]
MHHLRQYLAMSILVLGCAHLDANEPEPANPNFRFGNATKHLYKSTGSARLHLHCFFPPNHRSSDKRAAIVFFFGGSWINGTPQQFVPHCRHLASRGMVGITAEYRVKSRHGTSPFECVQDGKSAIRWLRRQATHLGIDQGRIAAGGGSAGGHVAAVAGNVRGLEDPNEDTSISSQPDALVLFNPVYDNGPGGYGHRQMQDRWRDISPLHNIRRGAPPTVVFLGTKDQLIPVSTAEKYKTLMVKAGSRCDLHLYENQTHGFFNWGRKNGRYAETLMAMDEFLVSLGWLTTTEHSE